MQYRRPGGAGAVIEKRGRGGRRRGRQETSSRDHAETVVSGNKNCFPSRIGAQKLGPAGARFKIFVSELKRDVGLQQMQRIEPLRVIFEVGIFGKARSVPECRVTRYCSGSSQLAPLLRRSSLPSEQLRSPSFFPRHRQN